MMRVQTVIALSLLALIVNCLNVSAGHNQTYSISEDHYSCHSSRLDAGDVLQYEFEVQDDMEIDVFLFDSINYEGYRDNENYEYFSEGSKLGASRGKVEFTIREGDTYYVVFDNTDNGLAVPNPYIHNGSVNVTVWIDVGKDTTTMDLIMTIGCILAFIVIGLFVILALVSTKFKSNTRVIVHTDRPPSRTEQPRRRLVREYQGNGDNKVRRKVRRQFGRR